MVCTRLKLWTTHGNRQGEPLQQGEVDVGIEADGLKRGKALGDGKEFLAHGRDMFKPLLQAKVGEVV